MRADICKTLDNIKKNSPRREVFRNNKNKQWRENWVAAKFCESLNWVGALVCTPVKDHGDDVFIKHDNKSYPFQVAEIAPHDPGVVKNLPLSKKDKNGLISCEVHGSLAPQMTTLIKALAQKKDQKCYANQENMNLLIYLNPPGAPIIDTKEDIDTVALTEQMRSSKFKTISLYENGTVIFIKGDINSLAQV